MRIKRDAAKVKQVGTHLDGEPQSHAYKAEISMKRVGGPDPTLSLEELKKHLEIARARLLYSSEQSTYWDIEKRKRMADFESASIVYYKKKHNLTDEDLENGLEESAVGTFQKKDTAE